MSSAPARSDTRVKDAVQVLTANRLREGDVVYLAAEGQWTRELEGALLVEGKAEAAERLAEAERAVDDRIVVGPYLFAVEVGPDGPSPISQRERIRAAHKPTVGSTLATAAAHSLARSAAQIVAAS